MLGPAQGPALFPERAPAFAEVRNVGPIGFRELMLLVKTDIALENQ
jgi:hypothetical protein